MRGLTQYITRRLNGEDGAVAVVVALLLVAFMGMAALTIDVGGAYQERRELQNGADAGALAIAEGCARDTIDCVVSVVEGIADDYADANAEDGAATVESLELDAANSEVSVTLLTEEAATGDNRLYHRFGPVIGIDSSEVRATATARWDAHPAGLRIFPLAFCIGAFNDVTDDGTSYGPPEYHVFYKVPGGDTYDCELAEDTGNDTYPGGFGWLDIHDEFYDLDDECHVTVSTGEWYPASPGNSPSNEPEWSDCLEYIEKKVDETDDEVEEDPLLVPIFDNHTGSGGGGEFRIVGFGAFRPTGFRFFGGGSYPGADPCTDPQARCVRGWFLEFLALEDVAGSAGGDFGVTTFSLID